MDVSKWADDGLIKMNKSHTNRSAKHNRNHNITDTPGFRTTIDIF